MFRLVTKLSKKFPRGHRQKRFIGTVPSKLVIDAINKKDSSVLLIDLRQAFDTHLLRLTGFTSIPMFGDIISPGLASLPKDKNIYLLDDYGVSADAAERELLKHGCKSVKIIEGGLFGYLLDGGQFEVQGELNCPEIQAARHLTEQPISRAALKQMILDRPEIFSEELLIAPEPNSFLKEDPFYKYG